MTSLPSVSNTDLARRNRECWNSLKKYSEAELEGAWLKYFKGPLPGHLLKKYLLAHLWYKMQEAKEGMQKLRVEKMKQPKYKEGTRLIREYQGYKYEVSILKDGGFFYRGKAYKNLPRIAKEIQEHTGMETCSSDIKNREAKSGKENNQSGNLYQKVLGRRPGYGL